MRKRIKVDHALAQQLRETNSHDARSLGWNVPARRSVDPSLPDDYFQPLLERIETQIHTSVQSRQAVENCSWLLAKDRGRFDEKTLIVAERGGGQAHRVRPEHRPLAGSTAMG